nr:MAG TPA: hypothetical protein [Caudoviricetes sp.]
MCNNIDFSLSRDKIQSSPVISPQKIGMRSITIQIRRKFQVAIL